jgi:hypothetical protein
MTRGLLAHPLVADLPYWMHFASFESTYHMINEIPQQRFAAKCQLNTFLIDEPGRGR